MKKIDYFIKKYLENRPFFYAFIRPQEAILFQKNLHLIKKPVLDFGCGDGFFAKLVIEDAVDIGLDLYMSRSNEAKKQKIYKRIVNYDGKKIPFPDNCFSTVISNCVLEHIPNLKQSLREIHRVLKPNGYFLATVMTNKWKDYLLGKKILGNIYVNWMDEIQQHYHLLNEKEWNIKFTQNGFKIIDRVGYLPRYSVRYNELLHYLSLPSLISYRLLGKWVLYKNVFASSPVINAVKRRTGFPVSAADSAAIFFSLQKSSLADGRKR